MNPKTKTKCIDLRFGLQTINVAIELNPAHFLRVWIHFNFNATRTFIKKQCREITNLFSQKLRTKQIMDMQLTYIFNIVLIPKFAYLTQVTPLTNNECSFFISPLFTNIKHKLFLSKLV